MDGSVKQMKERGVVNGKPYWRITVSAGKDKVTGKYIRRTYGFRGSKREADAFKRERVAEVEAGRIGGTSGSVASLLEMWFEAGVSKKGMPWSPTTKQRYRNLLDNHILNDRYGVGAIQLRKLRVHDLDELYTEMTRRGLSPGSVRQAHAIVHRALGEAVRKEWVPANVASSAAPPGVGKAKLVVPTTDEVLRLFDAAATSKNPEMASLIFVASTTGMRRGELCGLLWRDVDLQRRALKVHQAVVNVTGEDRVVRPTKTHAEAWLALDSATVDVLADHREVMEARAAMMESKLRPGAFVWSNEPDGVIPWRPDGVTQAITRLRDRLGMPHVHLHSLRHWAATSAIAGGEDIRTVAGRLRHAKTSTTLDIYAGFVEARDQQVADRLGGLLTRRDAELEVSRLSEAAVAGFRTSTGLSSHPLTAGGEP